jgi:hypothetical protein
MDDITIDIWSCVPQAVLIVPAAINCSDNGVRRCEQELFCGTESLQKYEHAPSSRIW